MTGFGHQPFLVYLRQMTVFMNKIILILSVLLPLAVSCGAPKENPMLEELDGVLKDKATYDGYFSDRMAVLKSVLADQDDPEQIYNINRRISDAYKSHSFDTTIFYLNRNKDIAQSLKDDFKADETDLLMIQSYIMAGYHAEAAEMYARFDPESVSQALWPLFVNVSHRYYGEMSAYISTDESAEEKLEWRDFYRGKLLAMTPEGSFDWYYLKREEADAARDYDKVTEYAGKMVEVAQVNTHDYAKGCYFYQEALQDDDPQRVEWLVRSAVADVMCSVKDYTSLNTLSRLLFENGDIDRAFRYAADHCMEDALYFNGRLRQWQISQFFPQIEQAYNERNMKQMKVMVILVVVVTFFMIVLVMLLLLIFKRQQILVAMQDKLKASYIEIDDRNHELVAINSKLTSLNAQIQEADKVKQEYIALFLSILSENINTTRQYKNHVLKNIRQGNAKKLVDEIEALPPIDEDIYEFYKMFDQTFVNLYPDFVAKFNELLVDGAAIVPKGDDILTPELRIFALIKLGITDSSKIASLLHYSANTIYNYRAKTKNKARGSRDEFEAAVRSIE